MYKTISIIITAQYQLQENQHKFNQGQFNIQYINQSQYEGKN